MVTRAIRSAQTQVEQQNFEIRKNVLKYDEVMNKQRTVIYDERRRVLDGEDISEQIEHMIADVIAAYVEGATAEGYAEDWDLDKLWTALGTLYPVGIRWQDVAEASDDDLTRDVAERGRARRRAGGLRPARGRDRRADRRAGRHARAGAAGAAAGDGPQVARAPLRDGLPQGGHRPAGDGPARPADRVPARGLRHVRRDAGGHQGGDGRVPVQRAGAAGRAGPSAAARRADGEPADPAAVRRQQPPAAGPVLQSRRPPPRQPRSGRPRVGPAAAPVGSRPRAAGTRRRNPTPPPACCPPRSAEPARPI